MTRFVIRGLFSASLALIALGISGTARAQDDTTSYYDWTNGGVTTDWLDGNNWTNVATSTIGTTPTAGSATDVAGGFTATIGTAANPNPTINIESLYVGQDSDMHTAAGLPAPSVGNGTVNQTAGIVNVGVVDPANTTSNNGWLKLGATAGTTGTYNMSGTAALNLSNDWLSVGEHGTGVLTMTDSAAVTTTQLTIGRWGDGTGTATMNGSSSLTSTGDIDVATQGTGTLTQGGSSTINQTGGWFYVANAGRSAPSTPTGTYTIKENATLTTSGRLYVGNGTGATATMTIGTSAADSPTVTTGDEIHVGDGGNGTLNLNAGTLTNSAGDIRIGLNGGTGTVNQTGGSAFFETSNTNWVNIGTSSNNTGTGTGGGGTGIYNISGGTMDSGVSGARLVVGGNGLNGNGTLNISGDSTVVNSNTEFDLGASTGSVGTVNQSGGTMNALNVGIWMGHNANGGGPSGGTGNYNISGGTLNAQQIRMGTASGGSAHFTQTGGSVTTTGDWLRVGDSSNTEADYTISGGSLQVHDTLMVAGEGSHVQGTLNISGTAAVNVDNRISLGQNGNAAGAGNTAILNQTGGTVTTAAVRVGWDGGNTGTYNMSAGSLTLTNNGTDGDLHIAGNGGNNTAATGAFNLSGTGTVMANNNIIDGDGGNATFTQTGGTLTQPQDQGHVFNVGDGGSTSPSGVATFSGGTTTIGWMANGNGGTGTVNFMPGANVSAARLMAGTGTNGTYNQTGGTVTSQNEISIGDSGGVGVYNISGGTLQTATTSTASTNGGGAQIGWNSTANGTVNQTGGTVILGGNGVQFAGRSAPGGDGGGGGQGTYNLSGGLLQSAAIYNLDTSATASGTFNFNGGTLRATASDGVTFANGTATPGTLPNYLYGAPGTQTTANVQAGGAIVDVNSFTISFGLGLLHSGVPADGGLTLSDSSAPGGGSLTLDAAGTFNGPTTVVANATAGPTLFIGNSLAVQNSSVNIQFSNSVQFVSGLGSATFGSLSGSGNLALADTAAGAVNLTAGGNGSSGTYSGVMSGGGSFTKAGTGSMRVTTTQTYSGTTRVNGGTLAFSSGVSLPNTSSVTVGGASATPGSMPTLAGPATITNGLTVNGVQVTGDAGHIAPHIGATIGTLSVGSLTLNGGSILDFNFGAPGTSDLIASSGALTLPAAGTGSITVNLNNLGGYTIGTYKIITESSTTNFSPTVFSVGTDISGFQSAFTNPGGTEIDMIVSAAPTWSDTAVDSNWANPANWVGGLIPGSTSGTTNTDTATFDRPSAVLTPAPDLGRNIQSISFNSNAGAYVIGTTGGNALLLTTGGKIQMTATVANNETVNAPLVLEGANGTYTFANNATDNTKVLVIGGGVTGGAAGNTILTLAGSNTGTVAGVNAVNGVIANGAATTLGILKTGSGLWLLGGNNTFTGGVDIEAGALALGNPGALNSAAPNAVTFGGASTGILALNGINPTISGLNTISPNATVVDGSPLGANATLTVNSASPSSYAGVLADGPGGGQLNLVVSGGSLTLSGNSSATGTTDVTGTATLTLASLNALQDSTLNMTVANSVQFTPGVATYNLGGLSGSAGLTLQDTAAGPITVNIGNNNSSTTYSGVMSGSGGMTKVGTGTLTLTNANTYTGTTRVSAGTLQLGNGTTSNGSVASGAIVNNATLAFANPNALLYAGSIFGTGSVTKSAAGTLTLTGNSTYSGGTTVSAGTLAVGPAAFASTSMGTGTVTLSGATLALQGSLASGLTASFYNNTPSAADPNNGNRDPDFISLTTMNAHFANGTSPAVTVLTSTAGKADLNYSSGIAPNDGARAPIFGLAGPTTANYGFPNLDNFEANFNGLINITTTGDYTFSTRSDDGSVLYIDGNDAPLVDNNFYQGMTTRSGTVHLTAGQHAIALGYYEGGGGLGFDTTYSGPDTAGATITIPNAVLVPDANPLAINAAQSYPNGVAVTATSTINITNSLAASVGPLSLSAATLNVTSSDASNTPYSLTFNGNSTLTGNGTINVANSTSGGAGQVNVTGLGETGGSHSLTKTGPGVLSMSGTGTYSGGTVIAASSGLLIANNPGSLGTGPVTLNNATTVRVVAGSPSVTNATLNGFNGGTNWTVNGNTVATPAFSGNTLTLTDNLGNEARSVFFNTPQSVASNFAIGFTYTATGAAGNLADGTAVIFQNQGLTALGGGGGALGYGGITPSVAYQINVYGPNTIGTGINANGATGGYTTTAPVDESSGDPINVVLIYNATGTTLTEILTDTVNGNSFTRTSALPSDIATLVGGPTAFFGFSGGTGGSESTQTVSNFSLGTGVASIYANGLVLTGGSNATVDVGGSADVPAVSMGALTVGSGTGTTLNLTATTMPIDTAYGLSVGPATINGNLSVNIANNGVGAGTLTLTGASNLAAGVTINQNSGTLRVNNTAGPATVGAGVTINVASAASMTIAGTVSALSGNGANAATPANRANINNSSTQAGGGGLNVTGTNQQVGGINGTGDTVVAAGASLTANHIVQSSLVISGDGVNNGIVTIAASDASGNPLAVAGGSAIAGSNAPMDLGGSSLLAASGSSSTASMVGGSTSGVNVGASTAAVPEPSSILLVVLGSLACLVPALRRKARKA